MARPRTNPPKLCACGCGQRVARNRKYAGPDCRPHKAEWFGGEPVGEHSVYARLDPLRRAEFRRFLQEPGRIGAYPTTYRG